MKPLVTVFCPTYNHELFIKDTIEGFLMQKTDFSVEYIIHDDASQDKTVEIIKEYEKNNCGKIRCICQNENQLSKDISFLVRTMLENAKGKYIAICEGDDYWTDPYKLQKQVDFLEANPDYGMVHTDMDQYHVESGRTEKSVQKLYNIPPAEGNVYYQILSGKTGCYILTAMIRKDLIKKYCDFEEWNRLGFLMGDLPMFYEISRHSKIKFFDYSTAVRRILSESATQSKNLKNRIKFNKSSYLVHKYFVDKYGADKKLKYDALITHYHKIFALGIAAGDKLTVRKTYIQLLKNGKVSIKEHIKYILCHIPYLSRIVNISLRKNYDRSEN